MRTTIINSKYSHDSWACGLACSLSICARASISSHFSHPIHIFLMLLLPPHINTLTHTAPRSHTAPFKKFLMHSTGTFERRRWYDKRNWYVYIVPQTHQRRRTNCFFVFLFFIRFFFFFIHSFINLKSTHKIINWITTSYSSNNNNQNIINHNSSRSAYTHTHTEYDYVCAVN